MRLGGSGTSKLGSIPSNGAQARDALAMGHGQFTAIAVAPFVIDCRSWLVGYINQPGIDLDKQERLGIYSIAARDFNGIVKSLASGEDVFELPGDSYDIEQARAWSRGFVNVMMEAPDEWDRLLEETPAKMSTMPMRLLDLGPEDLAAKRGMAETISLSIDDLELAMTAGIRVAVPKLYQVAKALRGPTQALNLLPGRNELCVCNSGKKYKKCCGA